VDSEGREIAINMNRGTFTFITAIQDETHRFANAYRRQQAALTCPLPPSIRSRSGFWPK